MSNFTFIVLGLFIYQLFAHDEERNNFNMILLLPHINSSQTLFFYSNKFAYRKSVFFLLLLICSRKRMMNSMKFYPFATLFLEIISLNLWMAFIPLLFYSCSSAGHFCGMRNSEKLAALNKRLLRFTCLSNDHISYYRTLLNELDRMASLYNRCI